MAAAAAIAQLRLKGQGDLRHPGLKAVQTATQLLNIINSAQTSLLVENEEMGYNTIITATAITLAPPKALAPSITVICNKSPKRRIAWGSAGY